ncbi:MAG: D-Ala-D-Ala carboxypeptidase family metallohydrolase [Myxococcota bacterium]
MSRLAWGWALAGYPGIRVSSWYRDTRTNKLAGGLVNSLHLLGLAVDLEGDPDELHHLFHTMRQVGLPVEEESDHLHIQAFPASLLPGGLSPTDT